MGPISGRGWRRASQHSNVVVNRTGVKRSLLDLSASTLILEDTRVVVDGRPEDSDGKSAAGRRAIALDPYTVKHLSRYVVKIDDEATAHERPMPKEFIAGGPTS